MILIRFFILSIFSLALSVAPLRAATYYVSNIGHDANTGLQGAPWATLQYAADNVSAGDVVLVADGTYAGFNMSRSGSSSAPITFRAEGTGAVINRNNPSTTDGINVESANYVVIDGFRVEDTGRAGVRVATSRGVVVQNCTIQRNQKWAIFTAFATDLQILNNICSSSVEQHGIYISNSSDAADNPVLSGNECFGNAKNGIQLNGDCNAGGDGIISGALLEGNVLHDNGWKGYSLISVYDSVIRNNVIYNNGVAGTGAGGIHLTDEPGCGFGSRNNIVVNNTVVEFNIAAVRIGEGARDNTLFNNVLIASSSGNTLAQDSGPNNVDGNSNIRVTSTAGLFEDAAGRDYRLVAGSAAIDVGLASFGGGTAPSTDIDGAPRPNGGAFDAGAYEHGAGTPPPPPPPGGGGPILGTHPRILLTPERMSVLRAAACRDDNGNVIPNCTPSSQWADLMSNVNNYPDKLDAWEWAMLWRITGNTTYRDNAISKADNRVAAGWQPIEAKNYRFLYLRDYIRSIACAYDWLYDELTATQRTNYVNYMLMLLYITYNDDAVSSSIYNVGGWGIDDPGNNFYYNFMMCLAYVGIALYGETPATFTWAGNTHPFKLPYNGTDYTDILQCFYDRFNQQAIDKWLNTRGQGGGWHEGNQYGPSSKRHMFEGLLVVRDAGGVDYFNDARTNFFVDATLYHIYATQPGGKVLYNGGDPGREPTMQVYDYDRHCMLTLLNGLQGRVESEYAQHWLSTAKTTMSLKDMRGLDFLFSRPSSPESAFDALPRSYYATGLGWVNSRSGWQDDAVSVSIMSTDKLSGHQHNDQNAFQLYRGTSGSGVDGWLITDVQPFSNGLRRSTSSHNVILVDGACQRAGDGTGHILNYEGADAYTYVQGEAADAYYDDQVTSCFSKGGTKQLSTFIREFVHVMPGYVVIFDRVTPINSSSVVTNTFHTHNQPVVTANVFEAENGDGKVFGKVLWPPSPVIRTEDEQIGDSQNHDTWLVEVEHPAPQANYQFMHYFYVTSAGTTTMPDAVKIDSQDGKMVGARIMDPTEEVILFFSSDPSGNPPAGSVLYEVGMGKETRHILYNLLPDTEYTVDVAVNHRVHRVTITEGPGMRTSHAGVLEFELPAGDTSVAASR